jgi:hypothetical protein
MTHNSGLIAICAWIFLAQGCGGDEPATTPGGGMQRSASAPGATVFIISPVNGATVSSPVNVKFGVSGIAITPAGEQRDNSGHHHLIVDADIPQANRPIENSQNHLHFGKGQTETLLELTPGQHTLQLELGDYMHFPHEPPVVSKLVVITVE